MNVRIGILGAGGWGTALSLLLCQNGHVVALWEYSPEYAQKMATLRQNPDFLPNVHIPEAIHITSDLKSVVEKKDVLLFAVPSHVFREVAIRTLECEIPKHALFISAVKGIENETLLRMSEVLKELYGEFILDDQIVVLSGPSHAEEVSRNIPTAIVAASDSTASAEKVQHIFMNPFFRVYTSNDVVGVELGGALKNIIAIAAGISDGVGYGDNTKAALMTRGIVEIARLGTAMGAQANTFYGLSGIGDLIVTCTSKYSRNRFVGEQIGKGRTLDDILKEMKMVAEGVRTTRSAVALAKKYGVEMPITQEVYEILFHNKNPKKAVYDLMTRTPKPESKVVR